MDTPRIIQEIQYAIAPAVMVSSSALLLLGFQNKFSNLASRFRALNQEKRNLLHKAERSAAEEARLGNLTQQVEQLARRAKHVKNAIIFTYLGILCFVGTSMLIFADGYVALQLYHLTIGIFILGFVLLLASSMEMITETRLFYEIISLEKKT